MTAAEMLEGALRHYGIPVVRTGNGKVEVAKGYVVEAEANGVYKLLQGGDVIAPFDDPDELCRFILTY